MKTLVATPDPDEPNGNAIRRGFTLSTFDFHGHQAAILTDERGHWVFPKQLCSFMGIDGENQRKRINRNHWSETWTATMAVQLPGDMQAREQFLLHQRRLPMWLGSITTTNIKDPATRAQVEQHQTEFADALANYLTEGVAVNPRAAQVATRPMTSAEMFAETARVFLEQEARLAVVEQQQAITAAKVDAIEGRHDWFTALGYAKLNNHPTGRPYLARVGKLASALIREQGAEPHPRQDATFGKVNTYPVAVLEQAFAGVGR